MFVQISATVFGGIAERALNYGGQHPIDRGNYGGI
jgi:hypothetical protein